MFQKLLVCCLLFLLISCGVKGKPLPPIEPPEIGDGRPQFKGAQELPDKPESDEDERSKVQDKSQP